jgi:hypothetical protein
MAKFEIFFTHCEKKSYTAKVEAETEEEAKRIFDNDPFSYVNEIDEGEFVEAFDLEIISTEEIIPE